MRRKIITLEQYKAMSQSEIDQLSAAEVARLELLKKEEEQEEQDKSESAAIKSKYAAKAPRGVFCLRVGDAKAWLRNMDRDLISMVAATAGNDPVGAAELILENCWLEGDERIKHDDDYFLEAIGLLQQLRTDKVGHIKKY